MQLIINACVYGKNTHLWEDLFLVNKAPKMLLAIQPSCIVNFGLRHWYPILSTQGEKKV